MRIPTSPSAVVRSSSARRTSSWRRSDRYDPGVGFCRPLSEMQQLGVLDRCDPDIRFHRPLSEKQLEVLRQVRSRQDSVDH